MRTTAGLMDREPRKLVDASTLIALARIGELGVIHRILAAIHLTPQVVKELDSPETPEQVPLEGFLDGPGVRVVEDPLQAEGTTEADLHEFEGLGLGEGEASLFLVHEPGDVLIIDDQNARRLAQVRGIRRTGLLGLLVAAVERGRIDAAHGFAVLRKLSQSDFRMTVALYDWARSRIEP